MKKSSHSGFTLLLSILVISMILSVALGITSIVIKENQLSTLVRESEGAFHAADKGIDCALFYHISYDRNVNAMGVSTPLPYSPFSTSSAFQLPPNMNTVTCNGSGNRLDSIWSVTSNAAAATTTFRLNFGAPPDAPCADVTIGNSNSGVNTTITSEGYNTCDPTSPRRTLRVIEVETNL